MTRVTLADAACATPEIPIAWLDPNATEPDAHAMADVLAVADRIQCVMLIAARRPQLIFDAFGLMEQAGHAEQVSAICREALFTPYRIAQARPYDQVVFRRVAVCDLELRACEAPTEEILLHAAARAFSYRRRDLGEALLALRHTASPAKLGAVVTMLSGRAILGRETAVLDTMIHAQVPSRAIAQGIARQILIPDQWRWYSAALSLGVAALEQAVLDVASWEHRRNDVPAGITARCTAREHVRRSASAAPILATP